MGDAIVNLVGPGNPNAVFHAHTAFDADLDLLDDLLHKAIASMDEDGEKVPLPLPPQPNPSTRWP
jgi:hypothetical protein